MQADQTVYLHPARAELLGSGAMVVGRHDYPDVVLEVDHTTDVRRRKLGIYEAWGFPEVGCWFRRSRADDGRSPGASGRGPLAVRGGMARGSGQGRLTETSSNGRRAGFGTSAG